MCKKDDVITNVLGVSPKALENTFNVYEFGFVENCEYDFSNEILQFFEKMQDNKNSKESSKSTMNQALMMSVLSGGGSGDMFSSPAFLLAKAIGGKKSDDIMSSLLLSSVVGDGSAISEMKKSCKKKSCYSDYGSLCERYLWYKRWSHDKRNG